MAGALLISPTPAFLSSLAHPSRRTLTSDEAEISRLKVSLGPGQIFFLTYLSACSKLSMKTVMQGPI
jgi:hypothetical protein